VDAEDQRTPVERHVESSYLDDPVEISGSPLSRRQRQTRRTVESYLRGGVMPRYMERLRDVDRGIAEQERLLRHSYDELREEHPDDPEGFARAWRERARAWTFPESLTELIDQHNEWYPIERQLPVDIRTRDYVKIHGRSYRRPKLGPAWVLERFPA
jgi:hypothetical protein